MASQALSLLTEGFSLSGGIDDELSNLVDRLKMVRALLSDAERKRFGLATVEMWLNKLKAVVHEADIVLNEYKKEVLRRKAERNRVHDFFFNNPFAFRHKMVHKIRDIITRLDITFKTAHEIGISVAEMINTGTEIEEIQPSHPGLGNLEVIGRDDDKSNIAAMLLQEGGKDLSTISIVGMPRQGKTTLARFAYRHDEVVNHFEEKVWVCAAADLDLTRILNEIAQSVASVNVHLSNTEGLIKKIRGSLEGKRYLLVLDDMRNEDPGKWEYVRNALLEVGGSRGSKILVTTRSEVVAKTIAASATYKLETR